MPVGVKGAGAGDLGETSYKRNCHWERGGSEGSGATQLGGGAQLAGGRCPVGGTGRGQRSGNRERPAKWHRWPQRLGSGRQGGGTGCDPGLWWLPILGGWLQLPRTLPTSGGPRTTRRGRRRRQQPLSERLQWEARTGSVLGGKLRVGCPVRPRCCSALPQQPGPDRRFPHRFSLFLAPLGVPAPGGAGMTRLAEARRAPGGLRRRAPSRAPTASEARRGCGGPAGGLRSLPARR